ncbi:hypothetical protein [Methanococcoides sp. AM1]|uniref:hypothetical protein n=1 Tax=Methanococcoides sp. AM1 TaxID=1201011 RepID=UPI0014383265|nr:hypothetical protein [Methanococcoides sp. AM1]
MGLAPWIAILSFLGLIYGSETNNDDVLQLSLVGLVSAFLLIAAGTEVISFFETNVYGSNAFGAANELINGTRNINSF